MNTRAADNPIRQMVAGVDEWVPVLGGKRKYINFDNAASTPPFVSVLQTVEDFMPWYSSVHRGSGYKSRLSTEMYEDARRIVGDFVGADPDEHVVIFGKNTTEAINKLSYRLGLNKADIVLISHLEHHSNDLPWRARATVKRIGITEGGSIDRQHFLELLERFSGRVKLVAISGASNVTGHLPDIHWFARRAHEYGAQIMVDCAQLAAHRPIQMRQLSDPAHLDYIVLSAHKMYAPFGTGALIGRRDTFARGQPEYRGGGTIAIVTPKTVDWALPPDSDEAGSPNVVGAVAMASAALNLRRIGFGAIMEHESMLLSYALRAMQALPGVTMYGGSSAQAGTRSGVIPFNISGYSPQLVAAVLGYEWGIGVRAGCFCAQPYVMQLLGLDRAAQNRLRSSVLHGRRDLLPGMVRVSFGLYNTIEEIDVLIEALYAIAEGRVANYQADRHTGTYTPKGWRDDYSRSFVLAPSAGES